MRCTEKTRMNKVYCTQPPRLIMYHTPIVGRQRHVSALRAPLGFARALHVLSKSYAGENTFYKYLKCIFGTIKVISPILVPA